ncbi:phosphatidylserine decarboxylase [Polyrhizophydium stewartii]|uniref:Phosphatidylserine decarboxylase n=1 Tax=Polyrhizophydium stewartii TaxID=2732419 RepID=A0ABR4NAT0_9FUNG
MRAATLKVKVICARSLLAKDRNGTSDPYVVVRLGDQQQKTHVVNRNLNPVWNTEMLFTITASHVQESLRFSVWDKDFLRSDFLGQFSIDVASIVQFASDYDETKTSNLWYVLNPRKPDEPVRGEIGFRIGFVGDIGADLLAMFNQSARKSLDQATLVSSDDPADDFYFNNYVSGGVHADDPRAETPAGMAGAPDPRASDPSLDATPVDKSLIDHSEFYGLLTIEIVNARNLPFEASRARTFNCDPFVTVSFGKRTFRTKVVRNSLNPEWGQRIFLHIKTYEVTSNWSVVFSVHDYEDFASNECIGSAELKIQHIISAAAKAPAFGISCSEFPLSNMAAPLKTRRHSAHESGTVLNIKIGFLTYAKIRANYFHRQMQLFGDDATQSINKVSLVTMLDAIESTYSDETIDGIFADTGKTPDQALSFEECAKQLESRLHTRSPYADDSGYDLDIGGPQPVHFDKTPYGVRQGERMMDRRTCYICQKQLRSTVDLDVVSHVALCAFVSPANSDNFVLGGLIGPNNASRKWFTKILAYSTSNDPTSGRSSSLGTVRYQDRATGQLCEERIPTYIRLGVRLLYQSKGSQTPEEDAAIRTLLRDLGRSRARHGLYTAQ